MRNSLFVKEENLKYIGVFIRYGSMYEYGIKFTTVLIRDIESNGETVADHQWFRINEGFENLQLQNGDIIEFNADVSAYVKGYLGKNKQLKKERCVRLDYQLINLSNIKVINNKRGEECGSEFDKRLAFASPRTSNE